MVGQDRLLEEFALVADVELKLFQKKNTKN